MTSRTGGRQERNGDTREAHHEGRLEGRTVALIGGGSGIGLRVAHQAAAAGARVVLGGRTPERLAAAAEQVGRAVTWRTVDVTDSSSLVASSGASTTPCAMPRPSWRRTDPWF
ncbi:SDR family NAD(P)-dependent oxidoreductase [Streptomyces sp. BH097]|uniref:SDR family NAD(P)-dependent oxidoreductase n=1 Tax=unclassified Streptomyces TaxID=2593676 RepID=UPI003BB58C58